MCGKFDCPQDSCCGTPGPAVDGFQEDVLNELMNIFSVIADRVRNKQELFDEEGEIMQALLNEGYRLHEADAALSLMQSLARNEPDDFFTIPKDGSPARMRVMTREERGRITVEAFGFVSKLARLGIISEDQREELLEKALTIHPERIEHDHIKALVAFILFAGPHERKHNAPAALRRIRKDAWN